MNTYFSTRGQTCPNNHCHLYQKECANNVIIHSTQTRRFQCQSCKKTWSNRTNTPYYRLRGDDEQFATFEKLYEQGTSIREIAHIIDTSTSTIQRWKKRFSY